MTKLFPPWPLLAWALALVVAAGVAHAEDAVLISSTAADLVPGAIITEDQTLSLPAQTDITVLFRSGSLVRLKGPFAGTLAAAHQTPGAPQSGASGLVQALRAQGIDASVVGASRNISSKDGALNGDRVIVDLGRSAIYCIDDSDTVWLRRSAEIPGNVRLRRGESVRELAWPEGAAQIAWPSEVKIEDSDRFEALDGTGAPRATLIFRRLKRPASATAWIAQTALLGCRDQAEPALRELAQATRGAN
jgi:hypothetical protein